MYIHGSTQAALCTLWTRVENCLASARFKIFKLLYLVIGIQRSSQMCVFKQIDQLIQVYKSMKYTKHVVERFEKRRIEVKLLTIKGILCCLCW